MADLKKSQLKKLKRPESYSEENKKLKKIRNRINTALFLHKNKDLAQFRKHNLVQSELPVSAKN